MNSERFFVLHTPSRLMWYTFKKRDFSYVLKDDISSNFYLVDMESKKVVEVLKTNMYKKEDIWDLAEKNNKPILHSSSMIEWDNDVPRNVVKHYVTIYANGGFITVRVRVVNC